MTTDDSRRIKHSGTREIAAHTPHSRQEEAAGCRRMKEQEVRYPTPQQARSARGQSGGRSGGGEEEERGREASQEEEQFNYTFSGSELADERATMIPATNSLSRRTTQAAKFSLGAGE